MCEKYNVIGKVKKLVGDPHDIEVEKTKEIVAMRGRSPDNPSDRTAGIQTRQRLELNTRGICNTLTSVQKDNMILETVRIRKWTSKK